MRYLRINPKDITPAGPLKFARIMAKKRQEGGGSAEAHSLLQAQAEEYCQRKGLKYLHVPGDMLRFIYGDSVAGVLRGGLYAWLLRVRRAISLALLGCPDLLVFRKLAKYNLVAAFEFKTGEAKPRQGQRKFAEGANVMVIRNIEDFRRELDEFERWILGVYQRGKNGN